MEMGSQNHEKTTLSAHGIRWLKAFLEKIVSKVLETARQTKKLGQDDPRRVIHSLKVGLALTLVSLFYYLKPLYHNFGVSTMWAVMTVVVIFEFSVGATIGKGLNRGLATLVAGALGIGATNLASMAGHVGQPILIAVFVFTLAAVSTFVRFFPSVKARYDYGFLIFILTFCLVSVSGIHGYELLALGLTRLSTVLLGGFICLIVSIFAYPVWAGQDLHNLVAGNIEKLGNFLEGSGGEYFIKSDSTKSKDKNSVLIGYRSILNSKSAEESLANFARWEPGHGDFLYRHPWKQYLKIGNLTRQCAYKLEALDQYLDSDVKVPQELVRKVQEICTIMSKESGEALTELAVCIKTMTRPPSPNPHVISSKSAAQNLNSLLKSHTIEAINIFQVLPLATVASTLADVVVCVEDIAECVNELASLANFKSAQENECLCKQLQKKDNTDVVINIDVTPPINLEH